MKKKSFISVLMITMLSLVISSCSYAGDTSSNLETSSDNQTSQDSSTSDSTLDSTSDSSTTSNDTTSIIEKFGTLEISSDISNGSVSFVGYENHSTVEIGTRVYVDYEADQNYVLDTLMINNISIINDLSFVVEEEITYLLTATFKEKVISSEEEKGSISFQNLKSGSISLSNLVLDNIEIASVGANSIFLDDDSNPNILRISSSNNGGNVTFNLENKVRIDSIELIGESYKNDQSNVTVTLDDESLTQSYENTTFEFNKDSVSSIKISTQSKQRYLLEEVIVNYVDNSTPIEPVLATLNILPTENGSVSVTPSNTDLYVGDTITINTNPDENYYTQSVKINGVNASIVATNKYTFKLSEQKNTLEVVFAQRSSGEQNFDYLYGNKQIFPDRGNQSISYDDYYESVRGLKGEALKEGLNDIIKGHTKLSYDGNDPRFKDIDVDPFNSNNIIMMYEGSLSKNTSYNNEHCWAKMYGNFGTSRGPGSDLHNLRPCDSNLNSTRNNRYFANVDSYDNSYSWWRSTMDGNKVSDTSNYFEPKDEFKGDIARIIFYMATRYEGEDGEVDLEVSGNINTNLYYDFTSGADGLHGNFDDLYEWATSGIDPVSDYEVNRNNICDQDYQHNRNPFIDHPEFIIMIYDKNYDGPGALM